MAGYCHLPNQTQINPIRPDTAEYCARINHLTTTEWDLIFEDFEDLEFNCFCTPICPEDDPSYLTSLCAYQGPDEHQQDRGSLNNV